jgi:uncharacterized protein (DUF1800 family)
MTHQAGSAAGSLWAPYVPDPAVSWDLRRVVHLHRRAGFAATWDELQRDLQQGPVASVDRLLAGHASRAPADFTATADLLADAAVASGDIARLKAWWFYRMLLGPDPLGERLTLGWHDHFATAQTKVEDAALMRRQNDTLRKYARARFGELLNGSVREPALLLYLDAPANRKGHPNENLARELMELFTLGVGQYSETDVKEAARALTGWTVEEGQFVEQPGPHDPGSKTLFGKTGPWGGADLVRLLLDHPATAERLAGKLCRLFFGEGALPSGAASALAAGLRENNLDIGWGVGLILRSRLFFAEANVRTRVLGPVEFAVGAARALGLFDPAPSTLALADWAARMGQDLFEPPNVGGWPGGRAWIHTRGLAARANYAAALLAGPDAGRPVRYDAEALPKKYGFGTGPEAALAYHHRLLFGNEPTETFRRRASGLGGAKLVAMLLSSPEAQLG